MSPKFFTRSRTHDASASVRQTKLSRRLKKHKPFDWSLEEPGSLWVCGQGERGQLGFHLEEQNMELRQLTINHNLDRIRDVKTGSIHSIVLTESGDVYTFGGNEHGALGRELALDEDGSYPGIVTLPGPAVRISAGESHSACLLRNGEVYVWGSFRTARGHVGVKLGRPKHEPIKIKRVRPCIDIASGDNHLIFLTNSGEAYTFGNGESGQLGRIFTDFRDTRGSVIDELRPGEVYTQNFEPVSRIWATTKACFVEEEHSGAIFAFGRNNNSQLCLQNHPYANAFFPVETYLRNVHAIAGGLNHTLVLTNDQKVHMVGHHNTEDLDEPRPELHLEMLLNVEQLNNKQARCISCGLNNSHVVTDDGQLYSWGCGFGYQFGIGSNDDLEEPTLINSYNLLHVRFMKISSSFAHTLCLAQPVDD